MCLVGSAATSARCVLYSENVRGGLTTDQKGAIAETAIVHAAVKLGIAVYRPVVEGGRYDLIFDLGRTLLRVQCKYAPFVNGVVLVRIYSSRRTASGLVRRLYTAGEIDAVAAYCPELDACYVLPAGRFTVNQQVHLRVERARNNQESRVHRADDYLLERLQSSILGP